MALRRIVVVTGPPGVGKNSLIERLIRDHGFVFPVPHTTRSLRPYEVDGLHYHFVTRQDMVSMITNDEFEIWTWMLANYYGYHKDTYYEAMSHHSDIILYMSGAMALEFRRKQMATLIFLKPPSDTFLQANILARGDNDETDRLRRHFHTEDLNGYLPFYDAVIEVGENAEETAQRFLQQLRATVT